MACKIRFSLIGIGLINCITLTGILSSDYALAQNEAIYKFAKDITVAIQVCDSVINSCPSDGGQHKGSGVIVGKSNNKYFVLTAGHVVGDRPNTYKITTHDGISYRINDQEIFRFDDEDLAVVSFRSNDTYNLAPLYIDCFLQLGNRNAPDNGTTDFEASEVCSLENIRFQGRSNLPSRPYLFVSGYSEKNYLNDSEVEFQLAPGVGRDWRRNLNYNGYDLAYTNLTFQGMSGGAVLSSSGHLIGIHGVSDGFYTPNEVIYFGDSFGIPVDAFISHLEEIIDFYQIQPSDLEFNFPQEKKELVDQKDFDSLFVYPVGDCRFSTLSSDQDSSRKDSLLKLADEFYKFDMIEEALQCIDLALRLDDQYPPLLIAKGLLQMRKSPSNSENLDSALVFFEQAIDYDSNYFLPWFYKGEIYRQEGRFKEAEDSYRESVKLYYAQTGGTDYNSSWFGLLAIYETQNQVTQSNAAELLYFTNDNNNLENLLKRGFALIELGFGRQLVDHTFRKAEDNLEHEDINSETQINAGLAMAALLDNQSQEAVEYLDAVDDDVELPQETRRLLSKAIFELGLYQDKSEQDKEGKNFQSALSSYDKALSLDPSNYSALFYSALIHLYELNNINLAKVKLENVAAIPGNIYPAEDLVDLVDKFQGWCRPDYSSTSSVNLSTGAAEFGFDVARVGNGIKSGWIHDGNASGMYQAECINFVSFFGMTENDFLRVENFVKNITPPRNRRYYD